MRLVLLGAPGSGKGTQAEMLAGKFNIPHISTGDIFRSNIKNGTELGRKAKEFIDRGALVPDSVTVDIIKHRLHENDCKEGFILDGFPRTLLQAAYLDNALEEMGNTLDFVIDIDVHDDDIIRRLSGRRICPVCGAGYHVIYRPAAEKGICDGCKSQIIQREDDKEETVVKRLKTYHEQTEPLIGYYKGKGRLYTVKGSGSIEETCKKIFEVLGVT